MTQDSWGRRPETFPRAQSSEKNLKPKILNRSEAPTQARSKLGKPPKTRAISQLRTWRNWKSQTSHHRGSQKSFLKRKFLTLKTKWIKRITLPIKIIESNQLRQISLRKKSRKSSHQGRFRRLLSVQRKLLRLLPIGLQQLKIRSYAWVQKLTMFEHLVPKDLIRLQTRFSEPKGLTEWWIFPQLRLPWKSRIRKL